MKPVVAKAPTARMVKRRSEDVMGVVACLTYASCSICMVLANKTVLSSYHLKPSFALLAFQAACSVVLLVLARQFQLLDVGFIRKDIALKWLPVNLMFLAMLYTSFRSLQLLSIPLVTIFKSSTNALILVGDVYLFGQRASGGVVASLAVIITGAVLAGWSDITFSFAGYCWMAANCWCVASGALLLVAGCWLLVAGCWLLVACCWLLLTCVVYRVCSTTCGYVLYMKYAMSSPALKSLSKFTLSYYNNLLGIPFSLVMAVLMGEMEPFLSHPAWFEGGFIVAMLGAGTLGLGLGLASMWCVAQTSPSTFSIVGSLSKIPLAVLGIIMFSDQVTMQLACFISLSLLGGVLFSYAKNQEAKKRAAASTLPTHSVSSK